MVPQAQILSLAEVEEALEAYNVTIPTEGATSEGENSLR